METKRVAVTVNELKVGDKFTLIGSKVVRTVLDILVGKRTRITYENKFTDEPVTMIYCNNEYFVRLDT